jgi:cysteine desulfurase
MIYFDNAASAKPRIEAIQAFNRVATENFANPAALHKGGIEAEKTVTAAREAVLSHFPVAGGGNLIFTSGATESNNLAILNSVKLRHKRKIVTTAIEHPSVASAINRLELDFEIVRVPPYRDILSAIDDNTALVSTTAVCGETGRVAANATTYAVIKARHPECVVHIDAAQGFLRGIPLDGDLVSISAHKIGGLPGIGGLYIKDRTRINPMLVGGDQQKGIRPGTEPTALIAAFHAAIQCEQVNLQPLCDRLTAGLNDFGLKINSVNNIPNIVNFSCGVKSEVMLHFMAEHGIYVSSGSACARGRKSQILSAYGIYDHDIDTAIRVSFGWQNTVEEVNQFLEVLEAGLKRWQVR